MADDANKLERVRELISGALEELDEPYIDKEVIIQRLKEAIEVLEDEPKEKEVARLLPVGVYLFPFDGETYRIPVYDLA